MADPVGLINGTNCILKTVDSGGSQIIIGGAVSNGMQLDNELIDVTNKSSGQKRTFLEGQAEQTLSHPMTCFYSDDTAYQLLRDRAVDRTLHTYIFDYGDKSQDAVFAVSFDDSVEKNAAVQTNFNFLSSGDFTQLQDESNFITSGGDNFITSDGEQFVVRG